MNTMKADDIITEQERRWEKEIAMEMATDEAIYRAFLAQRKIFDKIFEVTNETGNV